ncbi:MAG: DUF4139 domain-containing protein, partial [Acidobacteriota bacterium]|nr:DUF4139 domain-containing protein [Acidobacteriota bacterium]
MSRRSAAWARKIGERRAAGGQIANDAAARRGFRPGKRPATGKEERIPTMRFISRWKLWVPVVCSLLLAAPFAAAQQPATAQSTAKDRTSLGITIYNSNFALVRETRRVSLPAGAVRLNFEGVPGSIEASTVYLRPVRGVGVLDQSYEYDLLNPQRLLEKYVGKEMTLVFRQMQNGTTHFNEVKAILLSTNGPVWKIGDEIVTGMNPDGYRFPALPGELYNRPTLVWMLKDASAGERSLDVSYLADQMNWHADYVLNLSREGGKGSLEGWVTLTNDSGAAFDNAQLSLVAGQVHRATTPPQPMPMMARAEIAAGPGAAQFAQEAAGEYHLYTLNRRVGLRDHESKQLSLLSAASVPVTKTYVLQGNPNIFRMPVPQGAPTPQAVRVNLSFRNDAASGLGQPLPAGIVRVYQPDSQGNLTLLGEDRIEHTPKDETARIDVGNAFDIVSERTQTDFRRVSNRVYESAFEITLRNHKDQAVTVEVREPVNGSW